MRPTHYLYFMRIAFALLIAVVVISWISQPVMAQEREIPGYVHLHLNNVVKQITPNKSMTNDHTIDFNTILFLLNHQNHRIASAAAYALGEIRNSQAVPALVSALKSDRDHMRRIAAHALGKIGDKRAVMPLIEVLSSGTQSLAVQTSATMSLGKIGGPEAEWILTQLNRAPRNWLQQTANSALLKIRSKQRINLATLN